MIKYKDSAPGSPKSMTKYECLDPGCSKSMTKYKGCAPGSTKIRAFDPWIQQKCDKLRGFVYWKHQKCNKIRGFGPWIQGWLPYFPPRPKFSEAHLAPKVCVQFVKWIIRRHFDSIMGMEAQKQPWEPQIWSIPAMRCSNCSLEAALEALSAI